MIQPCLISCQVTPFVRKEEVDTKNRFRRYRPKVVGIENPSDTGYHCAQSEGKQLKSEGVQTSGTDGILVQTYSIKNSPLHQTWPHTTIQWQWQT